MRRCLLSAMRSGAVVLGVRVGSVGAIALAMAAGSAGAPAVASPSAAARVRVAVGDHRERHGAAILQDLRRFLAIPNVASDLPNIERNAQLLIDMMESRGIVAKRLEVAGAPPAIYGELRAPGAERTVVFYAHYDGQPVDAAAWSGDPWTPVLRDGPLPGGRLIDWHESDPTMNDEWRIYGRSASDDKAPIIALLAALDVLRSAGIEPSVNLKFFFEGEEEAGSPHLAAILRRHARELQADLWIMCDGPVHQSRRMQVFFGVRGVTGVEMTVYGPLRPLHSGHYGNWAPNPIATLSHLLAGMRDPEGNILIPGFYDDVRDSTPEEAAALQRIPDRRAALMDELALARTEGEGRSLEATLLRPAINLRGVAAGGVGESARNAIATEARASIGFRLVPDQTPDKVRRRFEAYLGDRGYHVVHQAPDAATRRAHPGVVRLEWGHGYPPARAPLDLPMSRAVVRVVQETIGAPIVEMPTLGGSLPLYLFQDVLDAPAIGVPMVNHDNNQHAADENLRLGNLWAGIAVYAGLMARLGPEWGVSATPPGAD